jgi:hypothetical protein
MKKYVDYRHIDVTNFYFYFKSQRYFASKEFSKKQNSKIWKFVSSSFILQFFGSILSFKKGEEP